MENIPVEEVADLVHLIWSRWMKHLFSVGDRKLQGKGTLVIPKWAADRWEHQMYTPYAKLSEEETESDREIALEILALLKELDV